MLKEIAINVWWAVLILIGLSVFVRLAYGLIKDFTKKD